MCEGKVLCSRWPQRHSGMEGVGLCTKSGQRRATAGRNARGSQIGSPETRDAKDKTHTRSTRRPAAVQFLREDQAHARSVRRPAAVQFVRYCSFARNMILFDCTLSTTQISSPSLLGLGPNKAYWCGSEHTSGREPIYPIFGCNKIK